MVNLSWLLEKIFELHGTVPRLLWRDGRAFQPIHMLIEVTYRCNLRCSFCHYLDIIEGRARPVGPSQGDVPLDALKRQIDALGRGRLISFAGGETLVRKDFPELLAHAARRHRVHIITNGSLIGEEVARAYVDLAPRHVWQPGLVLVEVSLQGDEARHDRIVQRPGSWRRAVAGIRHLNRLRDAAGKQFPKLDLKMVVSRDTVDAMVPYVELARELGVEIVNFLAEHDLTHNSEGGQFRHAQRPQRPPDGVDPVLLREQLIRAHRVAEACGVQVRLTPRVPIDEFVRHYTADRRLDPAEYVCEGPWSRVGISGDGRFSPLCSYEVSGDVQCESLPAVWNGERMRAFRRATQAAGIHPGCHGCCNLKYVGPTPHGLRGVADEAAATGPPA